ncbi:3-methyladenine DNA glycosylase [Nocardia lijiangensis]|uniref:3-methyladenine DNA glycosylase n=1 Tax=Nocardia lijiangensis TaxID=299618 RepID=UPI000AC4582E|nr:3-methyladenine DNA glycosylase [Nocardia lijiangensis]
MVESVLAEQDWRVRAAAYQARLDELVGPYLERRAAGSVHPVIDFLFTYYGNKPAQLRRWHPGFGVGLAGAREYKGARGYHRAPGVSDQVTAPDSFSRITAPESFSQVATHDRYGHTVALERSAAAEPGGERGVSGATGREPGPVFTADPAYLARRRDTIEFVANLLRATASRPAQLSCFGLHEWAMVYRTDDVRHRQVPLRLGSTGTDAVVEAMSLRCTHFDAFRFFTPEAVGRNAQPLTRADQVTREQPGCLHANMDLYKWSFKLVPLVSSQLLLECFELACDARELDMRASPYDLGEYDYTPIPIETPSGRAEYVRRQAELAERAAALRGALLATCEKLLEAGAEHAVG